MGRFCIWHEVIFILRILYGSKYTWLRYEVTDTTSNIVKLLKNFSTYCNVSGVRVLIQSYFAVVQWRLLCVGVFSVFSSCLTVEERKFTTTVYQAQDSLRSNTHDLRATISFQRQIASTLALNAAAPFLLGRWYTDTDIKGGNGLLCTAYVILKNGQSVLYNMVCMAFFYFFGDRC